MRRGALAAPSTERRAGPYEGGGGLGLAPASEIWELGAATLGERKTSGRSPAFNDLGWLIFR